MTSRRRARDTSAASKTSSASTVLKLSSIRSIGTVTAVRSRAAKASTLFAARPGSPSGIERQSDDEPLGGVRADEPRDRVEIALATAARNRLQRLRRQPEPVGHRHPDAAGAEIDRDHPHSKKCIP